MMPAMRLHKVRPSRREAQFNSLDHVLWVYEDAKTAGEDPFRFVGVFVRVLESLRESRDLPDTSKPIRVYSAVIATSGRLASHL